MVGVSFQSLIGSAGSVDLAFEYVAHVTSGTPSLDLMANIEAGDLLVYIAWAMNNGGTAGDVPTFSVPSGWTGFDGAVSWNASSPASTNANRVRAMYKIADGTEDSTSVSYLSDSTVDRNICWQYRSNRTITGLSVSAAVSSLTNGNPTEQTIAASAGVAPVLGFTMFRGASAVDPRTTSITPNHEVEVISTNCYAHDYIQNSNPQDYTFDMDDEGNSNGIFGFYLHTFTT